MSDTPNQTPSETSVSINDIAGTVVITTDLNPVSPQEDTPATTEEAIVLTPVSDKRTFYSENGYFDKSMKFTSTDGHYHTNLHALAKHINTPDLIRNITVATPLEDIRRQIRPTMWESHSYTSFGQTKVSYHQVLCQKTGHVIDNRDVIAVRVRKPSDPPLSRWALAEVDVGTIVLYAVETDRGATRLLYRVTDILPYPGELRKTKRKFGALNLTLIGIHREKGRLSTPEAWYSSSDPLAKKIMGRLVHNVRCNIARDKKKLPPALNMNLVRILDRDVEIKEDVETTTSILCEPNRFEELFRETCIARRTCKEPYNLRETLGQFSVQRNYGDPEKDEVPCLALSVFLPALETSEKKDGESENNLLSTGVRIVTTIASDASIPVSIIRLFPVFKVYPKRVADILEAGPEADRTFAFMTRL